MNCKFIDRCPMFPKFHSKGILEIYELNYCNTSFETCERYKLANGGTMPPPELLPDGGTLASSGS